MQALKDQVGVIQTIIQGAILVRAGVNQEIIEVQDHQQETRQAEVLLTVLQEVVHLAAVQEDVGN